MGRTYNHHAAMAATMTGTPTPTLTPMIILLSTPPTSPSGCAPDSPGSPGSSGLSVSVSLGGIYEAGLPVVASTDLMFVPKGTGLATTLSVEVGNTAVEPDGTAVISVLVLITFVVLWSEAGQLVRPGDWQTTPVYVTLSNRVVVSSSSSSLALAVKGDAADDDNPMVGVMTVVVVVPWVAQASAMVV